MRHVRRGLDSVSGFSLIELMIVVAIIGILAMFAIPNFQRFQAKARQSEARAQLSAYYSASKAFWAEWNFYPGNFIAIGYRPEGQLTYRITSADNGGKPSVFTGQPDGPACITTVSGTCNGAQAAYETWVENTATVMDPTVAAVAATATTFTATASANLGTGNADSWTVNQSKTFTQDQNGLP